MTWGRERETTGDRGGPMSDARLRVFSVTIACTQIPSCSAERLADALMAIPDVVTVRVEFGRRAIIYRVDAQDGDLEAAIEPARDVGSAFGLEFQIANAQQLSLHRHGEQIPPIDRGHYQDNNCPYGRRRDISILDA